MSASAQNDKDTNLLMNEVAKFLTKARGNTRLNMFYFSGLFIIYLCSRFFNKLE